MAATVTPASSSSTRGKKKGRARASEGKRARLSASTQGRKDARQQVRCSARAWRTRPGHASPFGQILEHVAGVGVGRVGAELGQIGADLDLGPKTKFEARELLYIFY